MLEMHVLKQKQRKVKKPIVAENQTQDTLAWAASTLQLSYDNQSGGTGLIHTFATSSTGSLSAECDISVGYKGYKTCYIPRERSVLEWSGGSTKGEAQGTSEAEREHWPFPRD